MRHPLRDTALVALFASLASADGKFLEAKFGKDLDLDGPWQAVLLLVPAEDLATRPAYLWPSTSELTMLLSTTAGGVYYHRDDSPRFDGYLQPEHSSYDPLMNQSSTRQLAQSGGVYFGALNFNATFFSISDRTYTLPNGVNYTSEVGTLGLGDQSHPINTSSILEQFKEAERIDSKTFGFHLGSSSLDLAGSLVLGGYDRSRALGTVGKFATDFAFLMDVYLGTETGYSPFNISHNISVYQGLDGDKDAQHRTRKLKGPKRAAVAELDVTFPYIFLPIGTCEAAAQHLPVVWNASIGLYLWDQNDPRYKSIVSSPAYLGFVLADRDAMNITIKVPFQLLNLTLLPPITETPTPYFPCKPSKSVLGAFKLGRAFLQATFMFVSYETGTAFVAQAPGPDTRQSIFVTPGPDVEDIESDPIELFADTWALSWKEIEAPENSDDSSSSEVTEESAQGLATGAKAGIAVVCVVVGLGGLAGAVFWTRRRKSRTAVQAESAEKSSPPREEVSLGGPPRELPANSKPAEIGFALPHEMTVPLPAAQAPEERVYHELPTEGK